MEGEREGQSAQAGASSCCGGAKENRPRKRRFLMSAQHDHESRARDEPTFPRLYPRLYPPSPSLSPSPSPYRNHCGSHQLPTRVYPTSIRDRCAAKHLSDYVLRAKLSRQRCQCPADALCWPSEAPALHVVLCSCTYRCCIHPLFGVSFAAASGQCPADWLFR